MRLEQFANPKGQGVPEALFFVGGRARSGRLCGNHIFSVYPLRPRPQGAENWPESPSNRRYTENSSFPYTRRRPCCD